MDSLNPIPHPKSPDVVSDAGDRRLPRTDPRPPDPEELPCPRCDSTNTKFCYYNNYNLSQPRHFCKSCRRYWTRGGALRKVPIGGGIRKPPSSSTKRRPRITTPINITSGGDNNATAQSKYADPVVSIPDPDLGSGPGNPNEAKSGILGCWWSGTGQIDPDVELLPLNGYGLELGPGCEDRVFDWLMEPVSGGGADAAAVVSGESPRCSTWRMGGGEGGGVAEAGDYFSWPDLAISTPPKALK